MESTIDISALRRAASAFQNALAFANNVEAKPPAEREFYAFESARAALIQHFECAYELSWKMLLRFLEADMGAEADILTRKDIFRISAEKRLISDCSRWFVFHTARNKTSHMYNEDIANEVYATAKTFSGDLQALIQTLEKRLC